jgi:hypothetical protein
MDAGAPAVDADAFRIYGEVLYTRAGSPVTVFHYFAVGPDCAARPVTITLTGPPAHGRFALSEGAEPANFGGRPLWAASDPRVRCEDRLVATRDGAYAPDPGFSGRDQLTVTFQEGEASFTDAIEVNVMTIAPAPPGPLQKSRRSPHARAAADKPKTASP